MSLKTPLAADAHIERLPDRSRGLIIPGSLLALLFAAALFGFGNLAGDPGVGWHLRAGALIAETRAVPSVDPFLPNGNLWVANQWLSELLGNFLLELGGWKLLHAVTILLGFLAHAVIPASALLGSRYPAAAAAAAVLCTLSVGSLQWMVRPLMVSFAGTALVFAWAMRLITRGGRPPWIASAAVFVLWANLHPAFPFGLAIIALAAIAGGVAREWALFSRGAAWFLVALSATFVNPFGLELHRGIFGLVGSSYFMNLNIEWKPPDLLDPFFLPFTASLLLSVLGCFCIVEKKLRTFTLGSVVLFGTYAIFARRGIPFFAIVSAPAIASFAMRALRPFVRWAWDTRIRVWPAFTGMAISLAVFFATDASPDRWSVHQWHPKKLVSIIEETGLPGVVFCHPNWGGYLTFRLWPVNHAFIDDRNEVNGPARYEEYFAAIQGRDITPLRDPHVRWALVPGNAALAEMLRQLSDWIEVEKDDDFALTERTDGAVLFRRAP